MSYFREWVSVSVSVSVCVCVCVCVCVYVCMCVCERVKFESCNGNHNVPVIWFPLLQTKSLSLAVYGSEDNSQAAPVIVSSPHGGSFHAFKDRHPRVI